MEGRLVLLLVSCPALAPGIFSHISLPGTVTIGQRVLGAALALPRGGERECVWECVDPGLRAAARGAGRRLAAFLPRRISPRETHASGSWKCEQSPQAGSPLRETLIAPVA